MAEEQLNIRIGVIDNASAKLTSVGAKVRQTGQKISATGREITTSLSLPIALAGGAAVRAFTKFETKLGDINTMLEVSDEQMGFYKDGILDIAKVVPKSIDELAEAAFFAVSAGKKGAEGLEYITDAGKLAVAGSVDVATAIRAVTSLTRGYGEESITAAAASDLLFNINKKGVTTFEEVANAIDKPVATAKLLGVSQKELAASFTTLVGTTGNADVVATQLQATFVGLLKPSTDLTTILGNLGYESSEALIKQKGFTGALKAMKAEAEKTNTPVKNLFNNVRAMNGVLPLMTTLSGELDTNMENMANSAGAATEAFEKQKLMTASLWQAFKNRFNIVLIKAGEIILPHLIEMMEWLSVKMEGMADWLDNLDPKWASFIVKAGLILVALGPVLLIVGKAISLIGLLISGVGSLVGVIGTMVAILGGPVVIGIGLAIAATILLIKYWDDIKFAAQVVWEAIKMAVTDAVNFIKNTIETVTNAISETWHAVWGAVSSFFQTTWNVITRIAEVTFAILIGAVVAFLDWIWPNWLETFTKIANWFSQVFEKIKTAWSTFSTWFKGKYTAGLTAFKNFWKLVWNSVKTIFSNIWIAIKEAFTEKWDAFVEVIDTAMEKLKGGFETVAEAIKGIFSGIWGAIKNGFITGINWVINKMNWLIEQYNKMPFAYPVALITPLGVEGPAPNFRNGGIVPGIGGSDNVRVNATPGELILNRAQQGSIAGQLGGASVIISGNNFYGDDEEFAERVGDTIMKQFKYGYNIQR